MKGGIILCLSLVICSCTPKLNEIYTHERKKENLDDFLSYSFSFDKKDSTFLYASKYLSDSVFGQYRITGNKLFLEELSRNWKCDSLLMANKPYLLFVSKYDSLPLKNHIVYVNEMRLETDENGLIQIKLEEWKSHKIHPLLYKPFVLKSNCQTILFYVEPIYFQNQSALNYKIRKNRIISKDRNSYFKVQ